MPKKFGNQNLNSEVSKMASQKKIEYSCKEDRSVAIKNKAVNVNSSVAKPSQVFESNIPELIKKFGSSFLLRT